MTWRHVTPQLKRGLRPQGSFPIVRILTAAVSLQKDGPGTRGEIAKRLDAVEGTVQMHLRTLERLGLVSSDPPPDSRKSGQGTAEGLVDSWVYAARATALW